MNITQLKWKCTLSALSVLLCIAATYVFLRGDGHWACEKSLAEDDPRFNRSVEAFLSANYNLPEEAFSWWQKLQWEKRSIDVFSKTVNRLFELFPHYPDTTKLSHDWCSTCAVVGNSANLQGSRYGPFIDSHDVIIRMNTARTEGYEADVGMRTTHHVMYPESAVDLDENTHLVLIPFKIMDLEWLAGATTTGFHALSYAEMKSNIKANKDLVMVVNPAFMRYVHLTWLGKKGRYPSTGFITLILALHICEEVHVFGYGADQDGNWSHYWEKLKDKKLKTGVHPGSHEYGIIKELHEQQKLQFFKGW